MSNSSNTNVKKKKSDAVAKYVLPLVFFFFFSVFWFRLCIDFKIEKYFPNLSQYSDAVDAVSALILFILLIFFFTFTIAYTIVAMKKHWSKSLDKFFTQITKPTVWFVIAILTVVVAEYKRFFVGCESDVIKLLLHNFYVSVIPCYCIVYFVILAVYICRKKIPDFKL